MKTAKLISLLAAASITALGCVISDDSGTTNGDTTDGSDTMTSATMTGTTMTSTTMTSTATDSMTDSTTVSTTADTTADTSADGSSSTTVDPTIFEFLPNPPEDYAQVDRKGFPAVNTGLNITGDKDAYNASNPVADAAGDWEDEALASLLLLHLGPMGMGNMDGTGLDDDLDTLMLVPCNGSGGVGDPDCEDQAFPLTQPDALAIDLDDPAGFPNGRALVDPVMDVILAVLLLSLDDHEVTTFAALPLNPPENDVEFGAEFPYLAPAN